MLDKFKNSALIIGIILNVLLVLSLGYLFYYSVPKKSELTQFAQVQVPDIVDSKLKTELSSLKKFQEIPLIIDQSEIGKQNPYNY